MKRSINDAEPVEQPDSDSAKKQKVVSDNANDDNDDDDDGTLQPQDNRMPKIPATPPEVPLTEEEQAEIKRKYSKSYQTIPKSVYRSKDYNLWPKIAYTVFRSQVNIHNSAYASDYIRHWFVEHEGLREPPPKAPRSAYAEYFRIKKHEWFLKHGKFTSKDNKKIAAMWKALSEDEQKAYHNKYDKIVAQCNVNDEFWQAEAEEWGKNKILKLKESGEESDPEKRVRLKMNHLSADDFYYYKWW